jgi:predicted dehydrogenase
MPNGIPRRAFLGIVPAVLAAPSILGCAGTPRRATGQAAAAERATDAPRIAVIGCGGRGADNLGELLGAGASIAALCDVDQNPLDAALRRVAEARPLEPAPRAFRDLRELLARRDEIGLDGVLVSTPDHTHAFATALALRAGLPAYCEKPLTHTIDESRRILELARAARVPTQMGTQIHATENYRRVVESIRSGAIGRVTSCDCWVNKGWCCGPTGPVTDPPASLDYDLWLGPAQQAPYIANLHPANWRKYWEYGTGTLGDMGCHMLDLPVWALGLDRARLGSVEIFATCDRIDRVACPEWTEASWAIPTTLDGTRTDPLVLRWFDNGRMSPTAQELGAKDRQDYHGRFNMVFQGTKGFLFANYGEHLIVPSAVAAETRSMIQPIASSPGHHREWLDAIRAWRKGDAGAADAPLCAFERATVLNEIVLSGTVAGRAGKPVQYDFRTQAFDGGCPIPHWRPAPRAGWSLSDADLDAVLKG